MNISQDNGLTGRIIGAAIDVHRHLGPDLAEAAYEEALSLKLGSLDIESRRQVPLPLVYKGVRLDCGYRLDILVEERLPVELKSVSELLAIHEAQVLTYQRIGGHPLALLINFHVAVLRDGIKRKAETRVWPPCAISPPEMEPLEAFDCLTREVARAAIEVHRHTGPGLLGSTYLACLCHELALRGLDHQTAHMVSLEFDGRCLGACGEVPLLVAGEVPVFPISAKMIAPIHTASALARLRQGGWKRCLILNFNSNRMLDGIKRVSL